MDEQRLNKVLLHLGNAVMAHHQSLQELMTHLAKSGEQQLAAKLVSSQEKAILALQRFVEEVDSKPPATPESMQ